MFISRHFCQLRVRNCTFGLLLARLIQFNPVLEKFYIHGLSSFEFLQVAVIFVSLRFVGGNLEKAEFWLLLASFLVFLGLLFIFLRLRLLLLGLFLFLLRFIVLF